MELEENLAEKWKTALETTDNPGAVLSSMVKTVLDVKENHIITLRKLIKVYGRIAVYYAILDSVGIEITGDPFKLLAYFCKKRLEAKPQVNNIIEVSEIKQKIADMKKDEIEYTL